MNEPLPLPNEDDYHWDTVLVRTMDRIRNSLPDEDEYGEFWFFAREFPRCYRHYLDHAGHRLRSIRVLYGEAWSYFRTELRKRGRRFFAMAFENHNSRVAYFDFESYVSVICTALDILARIAGLAYAEQVPVSFNKLCAKRSIVTGPVLLLRAAKSRWVEKLKDYRDCFTHYVPPETSLAFGLNHYRDGWMVRASLPTNPNARDIYSFRRSRRCEVLTYSISIQRHMRALDRAIGSSIERLFRAGKYPMRLSGLFSVGQRTRASIPTVC